jgi:hypothetical protein
MRATKPGIFNAFANDAGTQADPDLFSEPVFLDTGYTAPAGIPEVPLLGDFNWLFFQALNALRYQSQRSISDWDTGEQDYGVGDVVRDTNNICYILLGTATPATAPSTDADNWYVWRRPPRPMTGETYAAPIDSWYNARGFRMTGKDHLGFDAGRIFDFREDWMDAVAANKTATAAVAAWFGRWNTAIDNGGSTPGLISLPGPYATDLSTRPWGPLVTVNACGTGVDAVSIVETAKPIIKMPGAALVFECDFSINGGSGPQTGTYASFGLGDGTLAANRTMGSISGSGAVAYGAYLEGNGGGNWTAYSRPNGGANSITSTSVAVARDAPHRWRCYVVGTSDSDDTTARVIQLVDGVVKSNDTVSLLNQMLYPFVRMYSSMGEVCSLALGPLRIQSRLALGDILI